MMQHDMTLYEVLRNDTAGADLQVCKFIYPSAQSTQVPRGMYVGDA